MHFQNAVILLLAPLVVALVFYRKIMERKSAVRFSSEKLLSDIGPTLKIKARNRMWYLRMAALLLITMALARPIWPIEDYKIKTEGIDIVLALDASTSMLAEDFTFDGKRENRFMVVRKVTEDFIGKRPNDKIGMVVFASRAYTACPLTVDKNWLLKNLDRAEVGMVGDGTAIGSGIMSSLNRMKNSKAKDKVVILLTDGRNNTGKVTPLVAAEAAKTLGVKIYTIGAGSRGPVPYPFRDKFGNIIYQRVEIDIDEDTLKKIASMTDGKYYRATDTESLREIYGEIDKLETYPIEEKGYKEYMELFPLFLIPGLVVLIFEIVLSNTLLRSIP